MTNETGPRPGSGSGDRLDPPVEAFEALAASAVQEDMGPGGDPTSAGAGGSDVSAAIVCRDGGVVAGTAGLDAVLRAVAARLGLAPEWRLEVDVGDGQRVSGGTVLGRLHGPAPLVLAAERPMLNLLGHLSGVASLTSSYVEAVSGSRAVIRDTRKTTPGLRRVEKYAVRCGGGANHRMGLYDALLVKDNHIALAGSLKEAVARARNTSPGLSLEVEVDDLTQLREALEIRCDLVLLDNMTLDQMAQAVAMAAGMAMTEASGRVTLDTVRDVAATGVDFIAVGALTHSAPSLDVGLDWRG